MSDAVKASTLNAKAWTFEAKDIGPKANAKALKHTARAASLRQQSYL